MLNDSLDERKRLTLMVAEGATDVQCIDLLEQVMAHYEDIPAVRRDAIAHWFITRYRDRSLDEHYTREE